MKKEIIDQLYNAFEQFALEVNGVDCWSARELQELLGCDVDLVEEGTLKPFAVESANRDKKLVYERAS